MAVEGIGLEELQENLKSLNTASYMYTCSGRYKAVMDASKKLNDYLAKHDGEKLFKYQVTKLYRMLEDVSQKAEEYMDGKTPTSQKSMVGKMRYKSVSRLHELAQMSLDRLDLETSADMSVTQILTDTQRQKISPESQVVAHVAVSGEAAGARSSSRMKVKNGDELVGFFTPDLQNESNYAKYRNFRKTNTPIFNALYADFEGLDSLKVIASMDNVKIPMDLVGAMAATINRMNVPTEQEKREAFRDLYLKAKHPELQSTAEDAPKPEDVVTAQERDALNAQADAIYDNPRFQLLYNHVLRDMKAVEKTLDGGASISGAVRGDQIARQNVAMSRVAEMMGIGDRIAKSTLAETEINGITVKGVMMDKAVGLDLSDKANRDTFNTPFLFSSESLRGIGEMTALDLICGNVDRHAGNMFYTFEKDEHGNQVLKNVQGIDNDASFGTVNQDVSGIHFISERMEKAVMALDEDTFTANLNGLLTPEQIKRSWAKVETLKSMVAERKTLPLKDDEWDKWFVTPEGMIEPKGVKMGVDFRDPGATVMAINTATIPEESDMDINFGGEKGTVRLKLKGRISYEMQQSAKDLKADIAQVNESVLSEAEKNMIIGALRDADKAEAEVRAKAWWEGVKVKRDALREEMDRRQEAIDATRAERLAAKYDEIDRERGIEVEAVRQDIIEQHNHDMVRNRVCLGLFVQHTEHLHPRIFGDEEKYNQMVTQLKALSDMQDDLLRDDKPIEVQKQKALMDQYTTTINALNDYAKNGLGIGPGTADRKETIMVMTKVLRKDLQALENQEFVKGKTTEQLMRESRSRLVILDPSVISAEAGQSSVRMHIPDKGYFTEDVSLRNPVPAMEQLKAKYLEESPFLTEDEKAVFRVSATNAQLGDRTNLKMDIMMEFAIQNGESWERTSPATKRALLENLYSSIGIRGDRFNTIMDDTQFMNSLGTYMKEISSMAVSYENFVSLGNIPEGHNLNDRNVALSVVADKLGLKKAVANSERVKLEIGDQIRYGTLMAEAKGVDMRKVKDIPGMQELKELSYSEQCLQQVNDMMFLDYICGNHDRNAGNLFYDIQIGEDGKPVMMGVTGIDNDLSFGLDYPRPGREIPNFTECMYIGKETYDRIQNLTKEDLSMSLKGLVTPSEIDAAWARVQYVKDKLADPDLGIQVLDEGMFSQKAKNPFDLVRNPMDKIMQDGRSSICNAGDFIHNKDVAFNIEGPSAAAKVVAERQAAKAAKEAAEREAAEREAAAKEAAAKEAAAKAAKAKDAQEPEKADKGKAKDAADKKPAEKWKAGKTEGLSEERKRDLLTRKRAYSESAASSRQDLTQKQTKRTPDRSVSKGMGD